MKLTYTREKEKLTLRGELRRTDGGSNGSVGGRGGGRWIEHVAVKGVGAFALADGDPRRAGKWLGGRYPKEFLVCLGGWSGYQHIEIMYTHLY